MAIQFKKKCTRCNQNYVLAGNRSRNVICFDCRKKDMEGVIEDPEMKKFFDIPNEFYEKSGFLCDIKANYLRYGSLSERQIETFKETVEKMKEKAKEEAAKEKEEKK